MFLGSIFTGQTTLSNSAPSEKSITTFAIKNVIIDEMYATRNILADVERDLPQTWDHNTLLHAYYQGNTYAGNVSYTTDIVDCVKIKKRFKGDFTWKTIYEKVINKAEDFAIELYDFIEPSEREIEYVYVAVIENIDTSSTASATVESKFYDYFIYGNDGEGYPLILDLKNDITYNRESSTIVSPGRKYPYVVNNGIARYYSGTLTVTFIEIKNCDLDIVNGWKYRNKLDQFLADGKPKILKSMEGEMWLVNIVDSLPRETNGHYQYQTHTINWVECGDPTLVADLYDNGFINTDVDRE